MQTTRFLTVICGSLKTLSLHAALELVLKFPQLGQDAVWLFFTPGYECLPLFGNAQAQTDNDDTLALLDCLGEGAAAEEGGPLREVCAKGVVEFLRYAIKQSSKRQQASAYCRSFAILAASLSSQLIRHPDATYSTGN